MIHQYESFAAPGVVKEWITKLRSFGIRARNSGNTVLFKSTKRSRAILKRLGGESQPVTLESTGFMRHTDPMYIDAVDSPSVNMG